MIAKKQEKHEEQIAKKNGNKSESKFGLVIIMKKGKKTSSISSLSRMWRNKNVKGPTWPQVDKFAKSTT